MDSKQYEELEGRNAVLLENTIHWLCGGHEVTLMLVSSERQISCHRGISYLRVDAM
jgi:hypothetical protein